MDLLFFLAGLLFSNPEAYFPSTTYYKTYITMNYIEEFKVETLRRNIHFYNSLQTFKLISQLIKANWKSIILEWDNLPK